VGGATICEDRTLRPPGGCGAGVSARRADGETPALQFARPAIWREPIYDPSDFALRIDSSYGGKQKKYRGDVMTQAAADKSDRLKNSQWWRPAVVANSVAGVVNSAFRGCWHSKMSWPVGVQGYSYQVCLSCGAKRLFDEDTFSAYGPFRYDLNAGVSPQASEGRESSGVSGL
jgi:hypothetical protein